MAISDEAATKIRLGNPVIIRGRDAPVEAEEACATARGKLVAIGAIEQGMFKPKRVFAGRILSANSPPRNFTRAVRSRNAMPYTETPTKRARSRQGCSPVGASPGTLIADPSASRSELSLTLISPDVRDHRQCQRRRCGRQLRQWPVIWLDCTGLASIPLIEEIGRIFNLHPLALEDVVNTGQRPKVDFYEDHAYVVVSHDRRRRRRTATSRSVFFGENFVVTFQEREGDPFDPVRKRIAAPCPAASAPAAPTSAYALIDSIVDSYFPPIEASGELVDRIEDQMLNAPQKHQMQAAPVAARHQRAEGRAVAAARRAGDADPQRRRLCEARDQGVFRDTLDHSIRLIELVETQGDMMTGLIEMHLSLSQARTNDVIGSLTIVSIIFLPLTFLLGVWGMNFDPDRRPGICRSSRPVRLPAGGSLFMAAGRGGRGGFFKWKKWL